MKTLVLVLLTVCAPLWSEDIVNAYKIGIHNACITKELAEKYRIDPRNGTLITEVTDGFPAANAGVKVGDIVYLINDLSIDRDSDIARAVQENDKLRMSIFRDGKFIKIMCGRIKTRRTITVNDEASLAERKKIYDSIPDKKLLKELLSESLSR